MGNLIIEKIKMAFGIRPYVDITTGEKRNYAYLMNNGSTHLDELSESLSSDYGQRAGKPSHVRENVVMVFEKIREELELGKEVVIDGFGRFRLTLRGPVSPESGRPTENSRICVSFRPLAKMEFKIGDFDLSCKDGTLLPPRITNVTSCTDAAQSGKVVRDSAIRIYGSRFMKDVRLTFSYEEEGEAMSLSVTPGEIEPSCMKVPFPVALKEVAAGTELTFTASSRMGVTDGPLLSCSRKAVLVEA